MACYVSVTDTSSAINEMQELKVSRLQPIVVYFPRWAKEGQANIVILR